MKWLMHVNNDIVTDKINDFPPFVFPPHEAVLVENDFIAAAILAHKANQGLIEVPITGKQHGLPVFDMEKAKKMATEARDSARRGLVMGYIKTQREDRIAANKPPLPPSPAIQKIIEEDGWDLQKEGITLMGSGFKIEDRSNGGEAQIGAMKDQIITLSETVKLLMEQNKLIMKQQKGKDV
jgi:hypothetical protein